MNTKSIDNIKIVLLMVEGNSEKVKKQFCPPFGILAAASVLLNHNIEVTVNHFIEDDNIEDNLRTSCEGAFIVGFSTMTSSNLRSTIRATRIVKELGYYTLWGGIHATLLPDLSLLEDSVDAVLRGEAESNLFQFILWRLGKIDKSQVEGLCYKDKDGKPIISNIPNPVEENELTGHSFDLINLSPYLDKEINDLESKNYINKRLLPYMTSKGCNMNCSFCYNSVVNRCKWRGYNVDVVFSEMDWLIERHGIEGWLFYDDNFFVDTDRAWNILEQFRMPSFVELNLGKVNTDFLSRGKKAGIEKIFIGIESGSDSILKKINKGINTKSIKEKIKLCKTMAMNVELSFMMLFPGETLNDLKMTFELVDELSQYDNVSIAGPKIYNPYPGTKLFNELLELGWIAPKSNTEWSIFERNISINDTGFMLTTEHIEFLKTKKLV